MNPQFEPFISSIQNYLFTERCELVLQITPRRRLRPLYFNSFSAGTVFIRQNLTSRRQILTYKEGPCARRVKITSFVKVFRG